MSRYKFHIYFEDGCEMEVLKRVDTKITIALEKLRGRKVEEVYYLGEKVTDYFDDVI